MSSGGEEGQHSQTQEEHQSEHADTDEGTHEDVPQDEEAQGGGSGSSSSHKQKSSSSSSSSRKEGSSAPKPEPTNEEQPANEEEPRKEEEEPKEEEPTNEEAELKNEEEEPAIEAREPEKEEVEPTNEEPQELASEEEQELASEEDGGDPEDAGENDPQTLYEEYVSPPKPQTLSSLSSESNETAEGEIDANSQAPTQGDEAEARSIDGPQATNVDAQEGPKADEAPAPEPEVKPVEPEEKKDSSSSSSSSKKEEKPAEEGTKMDQEIQKMDTSSSDSSSYYSDEDDDDKDEEPLPTFQGTSLETTKNEPTTTSKEATPMRKTKRPDDLPLNLNAIVFHARDSLTYKALLGIQLHGMPQTMLTSVVNDLRKYVETAVDTGLIDEAVYIQKCIDNIRSDKSAEKYEADKTMRDLDHKIAEAQAELSERMAFWDNEQAMMERELEMTLMDININEDEALSELDREWQSPKKQKMYSKPSPGLLNLRHVAKKMIRIKNFEGVKQMAAVIEVREREETSDAASRMNNDYHHADAKMKQQYEVERSNILQNHEKKLHNLQRAREANLRPITQRIQNLEKLRQEASNTVKKCQEAMAASAAMSPRSSVTTSRATSRTATRGGDRGIPGQPPSQLPALMSKPKLTLPPIARIKRDGAKSQARQTKKPIQKTMCRPQTLQRLSSLNYGRPTGTPNVL